MGARVNPVADLCTTTQRHADVDSAGSGRSLGRPGGTYSNAGHSTVRLQLRSS